MGSRKSKGKPAKSARGPTAPLTKTGATTSPQQVGPSGSAALTVSVEGFSGPLPHPVHFAGYEQTLPGAADRILRTFEQEVSHRQSHELAQLNLHGAAQKRSQWFGFILYGLCIVAATYVLSLGLTPLGTGILLSAVAVAIGEWLSMMVLKFRAAPKRATERPGFGQASGPPPAG